jgi:biopolymer transport protein ExbD
MSGGGSTGDSDEPDLTLNLTSLMDVLSNLLFFLLASFGAAVISVVSASVPVSSTDNSDVAKTTDEVTMTVSINPDGYRITAGSETLPPEELASYKYTIPRTNHPPSDAPKNSHPLNELDYPKLTQALYTVKQKYPKSETVILVPDPKILYDEVVQSMDACREKLDKDARGATLKQTLFGKVVVSTTVQ